MRDHLLSRQLLCSEQFEEHWSGLGVNKSSRQS